MYHLIEVIMKFFIPHSTADKILAAIDGFSVSMCIAFFGFGFKDAVDVLFPTFILCLTVISLGLTIVKKMFDLFDYLKKRFKW